MTKTALNKGPWTHRVLVCVFAALFGVLIYWLLGFVMRDIGTWPGPDQQAIEKTMIDAALLKEVERLGIQVEETTRATASRRERQAVLRDSTSNSERTMNQLLELQKLSLQKGLATSAEDAKALAESQQLFLANQSKYQVMNDQIATLNEDLGRLQSLQRDRQARLDPQRAASLKEYDRQMARHQLGVAAIKLAVLLPLLGLAVWLFLKKRGSLYATLIYGFGVALVIMVAEVMHEHFPSRYFKYVLLLVALALVTRILIFLLRTMAFPKMDWLLKQYRDAYEHFLCPVCNHPIRRGPLKNLFWTRGSLKKLHVPTAPAPAPEEAYVCPVCTTTLFEECIFCAHIRHSLLPACSHCGAVKPLESSAVVAPPADPEPSPQ